MGFDYAKRISLLKQKTEDDRSGRVGYVRAFFISFAGLALLIFALNKFSGAPVAEESEVDEAVAWQNTTSRQFEERLHWLESSPLAVTPFGSELYYIYGRSIVDTLHYDAPPPNEGDLIDLHLWFQSFLQTLVDILLRIGFVAVAAWPLWIISAIVGYYAFRRRFVHKRTDDLLGICDRGVSPFYSGIYGPFRPNGSFSATDLSCPNLACPQMVDTQQAVGHPLAELLRKYGALNHTNTDLIRVILKYGDYPATVDSEQSTMGEEEETTDEQLPQTSRTGFVTNTSGTVEQSAIQGLKAILEAHQILQQYLGVLEQKKINNAQINANHEGHLALIQPLMENTSPDAKLLLNTLTPNRAWAMGYMPSHLVAAAYLAIEAGKSLVYKRHGDGFTRISLFPHLQARAVIQSLLSYHQEYNGDMRLIVRQAIMCSRRHGDFGRAFLPERMPVESRAIRDWLEVLYEAPSQREVPAYLVELDAHIEEISVNWKMGYARRVRQIHEQSVNAKNPFGPRTLLAERFAKGIVYKSVVLVPIQDVVSIALRGIDNGRLRRITQLLQLTHRQQANISISARLPGFKRQATEAFQGGNDMEAFLASDELNRELKERWVVVRRMLTKYNWLSTRVGDDAVPAEGLVKGIVLEPAPDTDKFDVFGFEALVPIRQRRHDELFGKQWENVLFWDKPHPENVRVHTDLQKYKTELAAEQMRASQMTGASLTDDKTSIASG